MAYRNRTYTAAPNAEKIDVYAKVTNHIVAAIERGAGQWQMPWHNKAGHAFSVQPVSLTTGKRYHGVNTITLWATAQAFGYDSALWGTFNHFKEKGARIRAGEKGTPVVYWNTVETEITNDAGETETKTRGFYKYYYVWNVAQVDGYTIAGDTGDQAELPMTARIDRAERFFDQLGFDVRHGGNRAYCSRADHRIQLPEFDQFRDADAYYATRAHESIHRVGHSDMLDRTFGKRFGDSEYAFEELVAELGAAFTCAHLQLSNEPRDDHAQYLQSWLGVLKSDSRAIFKASRLAQTATDKLVELAGDYETASSPVESAPVVEAKPEPKPFVPVLGGGNLWTRNPKFVPCKRGHSARVGNCAGAATTVTSRMMG